DWESAKEMIKHGFVADESDAARRAILAGLDMEMVSTCYRSKLAALVEHGDVPISAVDDAVRGVLRAKERLGLFDHPYTDEKRGAETTLPAAHRAAARESARRSIVLLKNDGNLLPLRGDLKSIAVIGRFADSPRDCLGCWSGRGRPEDVVTPLAAIRQRAGD